MSRAAVTGPESRLTRLAGDLCELQVSSAVLCATEKLQGGQLAPRHKAAADYGGFRVLLTPSRGQQAGV